MTKSKRKRDHTPVLTEGRTLRIVKRQHQKETMKALIAVLKETIREQYAARFDAGFAAGVEHTRGTKTDAPAA